MSRGKEESVRWLLTSSIDIRDVRSRIYSVDSIRELRIWVKVFNEIRDQMHPDRQQAVIETVEKRHQMLQDD